jgi:hypothetical protein
MVNLTVLACRRGGLGFRFRDALDAPTFFVPPFLERLFGLDILQIVLGSCGFADFVLLGLLLHQDRG